MHPEALLAMAVGVGAANAWAGTVASVHDADTVHVSVVDTLISVPVTLAVRVLGVNARELSQPGGREAAAALTAALPPGTVVTLRSVKPDKFAGRIDATLTTQDGVDVATWLISNNWAAPWSGAGERPLPPWPRPAA